MKRWKLWTAAILLLLLVVLILAWPSAPRIVISKETTYITEPLKPDGTVDYIAALNQRLSEGVTPETNAAVLFWQAAGPNGFPPGLREEYDEYSEKLGIPPLPKTGDYYVASHKFFKSFFPPLVIVEFDGPLPIEMRDEMERHESFSKKWNEAKKRPWSKEEFPELANWIKQNEKPMELVVEGCRRPRFYLPFISVGTIEDLRICEVPFGYPHRDMVEYLIRRAMLRLHEDNLDGVWEDLLTCYRLNRLVRRGPGQMEPYNVVYFDEHLFFSVQNILRCPRLSAAKIAEIRADLDGLPPMSKIADEIDLFARFQILETAYSFVRADFFVSGKVLDDAATSAFGAIVRRGVNWNPVLRAFNAWCDRYVTALRKPTRWERAEGRKKIEEELHKAKARLGTWKRSVLSALGNPRGALSDHAIYESTSRLFREYDYLLDWEDVWTTEFELTKLAFALAAYQADNGTYPEKFADLVPEYVAEVPKDIFNDAELHYQRDGDGYLLYSVGPNGRDDGGKATEVRTMADWDDIAIRIPDSRGDH
jgi:hypothetical protein